MNVFEDLIVELKQENLLEQTVIDKGRNVREATRHPDETEAPTEAQHSTVTTFDSDVNEAGIVDSDPVELDSYDSHQPDTTELAVDEPPPEAVQKPGSGQEFYRKRAMAEVSNLQMVDHVITGVEREYMKILPKVFDDFQAKKALNTFLQVTENENSEEHKEAEFQLMTETEAWCSALSERDRDVAVSNLRHYCENSRPPLSSQALVALAQFYRNLPHSESVRSKFDFVITRLFSRPIENEMRAAFFTRDEAYGHLQTLYSDWSSIALYGADDDESKVALTALSFEDLAIEAENAGSFDGLIEKDFFGRVRGFKESIGEMFYAPNVLAAAIEANVRIGNAYVKLIDLERRKMDAESIQTKYGDRHDDSVSEGIGRTLDLVDLLRSPLNNGVTPGEESTNEAEGKTDEKVAEVAEVPVVAVVRKRPPLVDKAIDSFLSMNRWLAGVSAALILLSVGVYIYANFFVTEKVASSDVRTVEVDDPVFKEFIQTGRVSGETFYGLLLPSWDNLSKQNKEDVLRKIHHAGQEKGYSQVNLIGKDGKPVAFASSSRLELIKD